MASVRSPSYPSIPLKDAIARARDLFDKERFNPISREAAAKILGYTGLTGGSNSLLADLAAYGLIERVGKGEVRISQLVAQILHPKDDSEYVAGLTQAALSPKLFAALRERFPDHLPSEDNLEGVLVRMGFSTRGTKPAKKSFLDTFSYLQEESASGNHDPSDDDDADADLPGDSTSFGGASVGDLVQWKSHGVPQFETPRRVRWVSDDGSWLAVEGSDTGIPVSQVIVETTAPPQPSAIPPLPPAEPRSEVPKGFSEWFRAKVGANKIVTINFKGEGEIGPKEIEKMIRVLEAQKLALED